MRRVTVAAVVLVTSWFAVWLVPGAVAEGPDATGWWAASRLTPISQSVPQPADVVPDTIPQRDNFGGTPIPQPPRIEQLPGSTPPVQGYAPVPEGGLYVAGAQVLVDGSLVPLEAVPDRTPTDSRIPFPTPSVTTPPQVPQEAPDVKTDQVLFGVSALRLYVGDDAAVGDLVLEFDTVEGREKKLGTVAIQACPPAIVWTPDEGGPIESRPQADCSQGLAYGEDTGPTVKIPVGGLVRDGLLDVVLLPQPGAAFQAVFKKPGAKSIEVTHYPASDGGEEFEDLPFFPDVACDCPLGEVPVFAGTGLLDATFALSDPVPYEVRPPVTGRSRSVSSGGSRLIADTVPELSTWQKAVAGGVLAALVALYLLLLKAPGGALLALGPWAARRQAEDPAEVARGIGRFARPRTGPNPRL